MKYNLKKVDELRDSYLNGNISYVREKVKRLNKAEFCFLMQDILQLSDNEEPEHLIYMLTLKP